MMPPDKEELFLIVLWMAAIALVAAIANWRTGFQIMGIVP